MLNKLQKINGAVLKSMCWSLMFSFVCFASSTEKVNALQGTDPQVFSIEEAVKGEEQNKTRTTLTYQLAGEANLTILWFDIYRARLYSPSGTVEDLKAPLKLQLEYQRDISREDLLNETRSQLEQNIPEAQLSVWIQALRGIWPDIKQGQQLTFEMLSPDKGRFYFQGCWLSDITFPGFARAFINIWLNEKGAYPKQAKQLKGKL